ncbi:hypothetical protein [Agrobacterium larrymoorei]|uniref:hypothetical protein n=1 Tax=Agrobacterium larrymoorei TaxID=160699 RepID=UPI0030C51667
MRTPIIAPKIIRVVPIQCPDTGKTNGTCVEFEAVISAENGVVTADLFVAEDVETVVAAIDRARRPGAVLTIMAQNAEGTNPVTGRPWLIGTIGPASEIDVPSVSGMIFAPEEGMVSCIFAPRVLRIYEAPDASPWFNGDMTKRLACIDIEAGDKGDGIAHIVVVDMNPQQARSYVENARIIRRPLVLWTDFPVPGCVHTSTGKPVFIGSLNRLGTRDPATV